MKKETHKGDAAEKTYSFGAVVSGDLDDAMVDRIYEIAPDSTVSVDRDGCGGLIEFDRESSDDMFGVIVGAIGQLEDLDLSIQRIEPDALVYAADIAERVGRSRQSVDFLIRGERGPGDFPEPLTHAGSRNPMWRWTDVERWFASYQGEPDDVDARVDAMMISLANSLIEVRRVLAVMPPARQEFFTKRLLETFRELVASREAS